MSFLCAVKYNIFFADYFILANFINKEIDIFTNSFIKN